MCVFGERELCVEIRFCLSFQILGGKRERGCCVLLPGPALPALFLLSCHDGKISQVPLCRRVLVTIVLFALHLWWPYGGSGWAGGMTYLDASDNLSEARALAIT